MLAIDAQPHVLADLRRALIGAQTRTDQRAAVGAEGAVPARVTQAQDIGTYWLLTTEVGGSGGAPSVVRARLGTRQPIPNPGEMVWLTLVGAHTCFYKDDVLVAEAAS